LIDPHTKEVREVVSAKALWELIIETRRRTGEPYLHFIDASNRALPSFQKKLGLAVRQSNICTEITLATDEDRTAVCCLASVNLVHWDTIKNDYQFFKDVAEMLDNALSIFIKKAPKEVSRAAYSAMRERAIGIGTLGWHELLQSKGIPFESALASSLNNQIFSTIKKHLDKANRELAKERGECPDAEGHGLRFSHMMAIAPNASSSIIMGNTSPSIEPFRNNGYRQDTLSGSYMNFNKELERILKSRLSPEDFEEARSSVIANAGSAQHLECLTEYEKDVFKSASELDQLWLVDHAAGRQPYIDQGQSLNLFFKANAPVSYMHHVHFQAWKKGLKTLYYCRSDKLYHGEANSNKTTRNQFEFDKKLEEGCLACE